MPPVLAPIRVEDLPEVGRFLTEHLDPRVPPQIWQDAVTPTAGEDHGLLLREAGRVVGAYLAIYSRREIRGRQVQVCNLAAWCVLPEYRLHSLGMLRSFVRRPQTHLVDLSPSGNVVGLNRRLGFVDLDTSGVMMPNLPWPSVPGRLRVVTDHARIAELLTGPQRRIFDDHRERAAARHVVLRRGDRWCYVIFRRDRRKGLPLFASVLHVSDPALFRSWARRFARHLLLRHGVPVTLVERRVAGGAVWPAIPLRAPRPKMYRSPDLAPEDIDYLYSELTHVAW